MFVRPPVWNNSTPTGWIGVYMDVAMFYYNLANSFNVGYNRTITICSLNKDYHAIVIKLLTYRSFTWLPWLRWIPKLPMFRKLLQYLCTLVDLAINNTTDFLVATATLATHFHIPSSRTFLEKLTDSQTVKKFPAFYGTPRFIIPGSQETGSCPFPEPDELIPPRVIHPVSLCSF